MRSSHFKDYIIVVPIGDLSIYLEEDVLDANKDIGIKEFKDTCNNIVKYLIYTMLLNRFGLVLLGNYYVSMEKNIPNVSYYESLVWGHLFSAIKILKLDSNSCYVLNVVIVNENAHIFLSKASNAKVR